MDTAIVVEALTVAIQERRIVRLGYARQRDGLVTIHYVAPIDVRPGETSKTSHIRYFWAYCFDQEQPETHLVSRIRSVTPTEDRFDPPTILKLWPDRWPLPATWSVPRDWG